MPSNSDDIKRLSEIFFQSNEAHLLKIYFPQHFEGSKHHRRTRYPITQHSIINQLNQTMVKYTLPTLSLALTLSQTPAFTTPHNIHQRHSVLQTSSLYSTETPLAPLTQWGSPISDVLSTHNEMQSKPLEFAPTISALNVGLERDDLEGQLEYVKKNKAEIKQRMVDCGAGEI